MSLFRPSAAVCCSADDVISTCCLLLQMRCTSTAEGGWGLRRVGGARLVVGGGLEVGSHGWEGIGGHQGAETGKVKRLHRVVTTL